MQDDALKWNERYKNDFMPHEASAFVLESCKYILSAFPKLSSYDRCPLALDLACGNGRHSKILANLGFEVDAVDISSVALQSIANIPRITPILADLDNFCLKANRYDLILDSFFLDRSLFDAIIASLKNGAIVLFETFIDLDSHSPSNDRALYNGELEAIFNAKSGFNTLYHNINELNNHKNKQIYSHTIQFITQYLEQK